MGAKPMLLAAGVAAMAIHNFLSTSALAAGPIAWGAGSDTQIDNFTSSTFTPILQRSIKAPANGVLMITGSVAMEDDGSLPGQAGLQFRLRIDSTPVYDEPWAFLVSANAAGGVPTDSGSYSVVIPVKAGRHVIYLDAKEIFSGSAIDGRSLAIVYFPAGTGMPIPKGGNGPVGQDPQ